MDAILTAKAEQLAGAMATKARTLAVLNGLMRSMMKSALERMFNTELDVHLDRRAIPALATESLAAGDVPAVPARRRQLTDHYCSQPGCHNRNNKVLAAGTSRRRFAHSASFFLLLNGLPVRTAGAWIKPPASWWPGHRKAIADVSQSNQGNQPFLPQSP